MKGLSEKISFRKRALGEPMKGLSRRIIISFKSAGHHAGGKHAEIIFGEKGQENLGSLPGNLPYLLPGLPSAK